MQNGDSYQSRHIKITRQSSLYLRTKSWSVISVAHGGLDAGLLGCSSRICCSQTGKLVQVRRSFCWPTSVVSFPVPRRYSTGEPQPWEAACCCRWDSKGGSSPLAWHSPLPPAWGMGSNLPCRHRCRWSAASCHWLLLGSSRLSCPEHGEHIFSLCMLNYQWVFASWYEQCT